MHTGWNIPRVSQSFAETMTIISKELCKVVFSGSDDQLNSVRKIPDIVKLYYLM